MSYFKALLCLPLFLLLSCQGDPSPKQVPFKKLKVVDKKLNDVSFDPSVDILFIVDDSGSMDKYQKKLADNASLFIKRFFKTKFVDYHIGVTTSTRRNGGSYPKSKAPGGELMEIDGHRFVSRDTVDGERVLAQMMNVGTDGDAGEEFFSIHTEAFSEEKIQGVNAGFYRENAKLAIFVLTDTEDQSRFSVADAYEFLVDLKDKDEKKLHYVAAIIENNSCSSESEEPRKLGAMVDEHKDRGYKFSLCQSDYGVDLAKVAADIVRSVSTIYLDELPDLTTIKVVYGDVVIPNDPEFGWVYSAEKNAIYLSPKIDIRDPETKELKITFESIYK